MAAWQWPWSKHVPAEVGPWPLSMPLLSLSKFDSVSLDRACCGILVLGTTGSGKTSASGRAIALAYLRAGFGGLVLCAKADERTLWEDYCRDAGRSDDVIIFNPKERWRFNFMDDEMSRPGDGAGLTANVVRLMNTILEMPLRRAGSASGGGDNAEYFRQASERLCTNSVDLLSMAGVPISIRALHILVTSAANSLAEANSESWAKNSFCAACLAEAAKRPMSESKADDFDLVSTYFRREWPKLAEKTRSVVESTFTSACDSLNRGLLKTLYGGETNITPAATEQGKIIIVDLPVLEYGSIGEFAQILWKYPFQRHVLRRDVRKNPRPVFLWQDEAQLFLIENDFQYQSACRSYRAATVMMSQNINNFYAVLGGKNAGESQCKSLFANLNLKCFHANGDYDSNEFAAKTIGTSRQYRVNANNSYNSANALTGPIDGSASHSSAGITEVWDFDIQPSEFSRLRTGGRENRKQVDCIICSTGSCFKATGKTFLRCTFSQK